MRWAAIFFVALLLLYGASPYFSFWRFTVALNSRNGARLAAYVDFPAVRESLKQQFRAALHRSQNNDQTKHKKFARLLTALGPSLGDRLADALVDTYITPIGLADLIANPQAAKDIQTSAGKPAVWKSVHWSRAKNAFFTGPRDFAVDVNGVRLHFRWEGLGWRLRKLDLPLGREKSQRNWTNFGRRAQMVLGCVKATKKGRISRSTPFYL
ncbi:MAG TPA: DUF2939 domain-containing protein [Chthoniobacterales bacterium]|jgi:hypothetical protein|nr:DUF2939 domain-containing protein [Chthoniobacterales bacterium]